MPKAWSPKKIREFSYPKSASKVVDEWFLKYASITDISNATGIARSTFFRWRKQMSDNSDLSLQDLMTVTNYKKCVDLEIRDWQENDKNKKAAKEKRDKLIKQAKELTAQLSAKGFDVQIKAPSEGKIKRRTRKTAKFEEILTLEQSAEPKNITLAKSMVQKLSDSDRKAYDKFKKDHKDD